MFYITLTSSWNIANLQQIIEGQFSAIVFFYLNPAKANHYGLTMVILVIWLIKDRARLVV